MSVTSVRPEVTDNLTTWRMVRDAVAGSKAVKAGNYLRPVNSHDRTPENDERNAARLDGAVYFNATGRTLQALTGIAFGKWPEVVLPPGLEFMRADADGSGVGLINLSQSAVSEVMQSGRAGLLADYPQTEGKASKADIAAGNVRPTVMLYQADAVINWRTTQRGAQTVLSMVVLKEVVEEWSDFTRTESDQYRVLKLGRLDGEDEGVADRYIMQVWRSNGGDWYVESEHAPLDASGKPWDLIPFAFIGATNNDAGPDQPPLYDLADMNLAHFRNSADFEESLFYAGQAQTWVIGADMQWLEEAQKGGLFVGSRAIGVAPQGGDVKMLQSEPVSALAEEMRHKVELMAQLGARLIAPGEAVRTATQSASEDKTSNSVLSLVCDNVSDAFRKALQWCARFAGETGDVDFTIGTEFSGLAFDAQQLTAAIAAVQGGLMPATDFWSYLRSLGLIEATKGNEEIRDELEGAATGPDLDGE